MTKNEPMFISRSETFKFITGETIVLPCEVANTGEYSIYTVVQTPPPPFSTHFPSIFHQAYRHELIHTRSLHLNAAVEGSAIQIIKPTLCDGHNYALIPPTGLNIILLPGHFDRRKTGAAVETDGQMSIQDMCSGYGVFAVVSFLAFHPSVHPSVLPCLRFTQVLAFEPWSVHVRFSI